MEEGLHPPNACRFAIEEANPISRLDVTLLAHHLMVPMRRMRTIMRAAAVLANSYLGLCVARRAWLGSQFREFKWDCEGPFSL
jgi:hypothetical protein